jgi:hypothetical protein
MLVLLMAATKILAIQAAQLFTQPSAMSALPALFVPATRALVLLKSLLLNKPALSNLPIDIEGVK